MHYFSAVVCLFLFVYSQAMKVKMGENEKGYWRKIIQCSSYGENIAHITEKPIYCEVSPTYTQSLVISTFFLKVYLSTKISPLLFSNRLLKMTSEHYDFYLHYSECDSEIADTILNMLETEYPKRKLKGYIPQRDFATVGSNFTLDDEMKKIDVIFILLSKNSDKDKEFMHINNIIISHHINKEGTRKTIPIYIDNDIEDRYIFKTLQGIDYNRKNFLLKMKNIFK